LADVSCGVNSVKRWPWRKILVTVSSLLILVGIIPISYLIWFGYAHNWNPMTMPLPPAIGTYSSPYFTTDLDKPYYLVVVSDRILDGQSASCMEGAKVIDSHACAGVGRLLDLDWEIVNEHGTVMQWGTYNDRIYSGEETRLGMYLAKLGSYLGCQTEISSGHSRFSIGISETGISTGPRIRFGEFLRFRGLLILGLHCFWPRRPDPSWSSSRAHRSEESFHSS
jgi:hypothetical protein